MNIKKDIENLIDSISSIELRHFLEVLAVCDGHKNVMRIHINFYKEYQDLILFAEKYNLYVSHTPFKLKVDWTNEIGDTFLKSVDWEDNTTEMFVAYISKNESINKIAETIEVESSNLEAGLLYQYPSCCCINYNEISEGKLWLDLLLENSTGIKFSPWSNKLSYLVHDYCLFPDYFPCSLSCEGTIKLSKSYYELAVKYNLEDFGKKQLEYMSGLYLVNEDYIISTKVYKLNGNIIEINFSELFTYNISKNEFDMVITNNKFDLTEMNGYSYININNHEFRVLIFE